MQNCEEVSALLCSTLLDATTQHQCDTTRRNSDRLVCEDWYYNFRLNVKAAIQDVRVLVKSDRSYARSQEALYSDRTVSNGKTGVDVLLKLAPCRWRLIIPDN